MSYRWVSREALLLLHGESLAQHGGAAGIRDAGLLESALARPENLAAYGTPDPFDCAAAYAFGIARNHPFVDGNKRAALLAAGMFMRLNGFRLTAGQPETTMTFLALAAGELEEDALAAWLRANARPVT